MTNFAQVLIDEKNIYIYIYSILDSSFLYKYLNIEKLAPQSRTRSIYNSDIRNKWRNFDIKYLGKLSAVFSGKAGKHVQIEMRSNIFLHLRENREQTVSKSHFHSIVHRGKGASLASNHPESYIVHIPFHSS